jgi:hypothetical protein
VLWRTGNGKGRSTDLLGNSQKQPRQNKKGTVPKTENIPHWLYWIQNESLFQQTLNPRPLLFCPFYTPKILAAAGEHNLKIKTYILFSATA